MLLDSHYDICDCRHSPTKKKEKKKDKTQHDIYLS